MFTPDILRKQLPRTLVKSSSTMMNTGATANTRTTGSACTIGTCTRGLRTHANNINKKKRFINIIKIPLYAIFICAVTEIAVPIVFEQYLKATLPPSIWERNGDELLPSPIGWSDVKVAIYMTTHFSDEHILFLPCWYDAVRRLNIFQHADLILYTSAYPNATLLQQLPFRKVTIKLYDNPGYQRGAIQAMIYPFFTETDLWFQEYDWVIRLNPDVLIRGDTWLIQTMLNTSIDAIVHDCENREPFPPKTGDSDDENLPLKFQTDFYAFRPHAIDRALLLSQVIPGGKKTNAEYHFTNAIRNIYNSSRFAYVEGAHNSQKHICRIEGRQSPVVHVHEIYKTCPYYYNATSIKGNY